MQESAAPSEDKGQQQLDAERSTAAPAQIVERPSAIEAPAQAVRKKWSPAKPEKNQAASASALPTVTGLPQTQAEPDHPAETGRIDAAEVQLQERENPTPTQPEMDSNVPPAAPPVRKQWKPKGK
jgi:hypothetical protein